MAKKRKRRPAEQSREPVPGELERDEASWSGFEVAAACGGVLIVLFLGWLGWHHLYTAGLLAGILSVAFTIGPYFIDIWKHTRRD